MTNSADRPKKPLPLPPLVPPGANGGNKKIEDEDDQTRVSLGKMPPLSSRPPASSNVQKDMINIGNKKPPSLDDDLDDMDDDGVTQINPTTKVPSLDAGRLGNKPPSSPPPLNKGGLPGRTSPSGGATTRRMPPEPTGVKRGSPIARSPLHPPATPQKEYVPLTPPAQRSPGQPSLEELIKIAYDEGYSDVHLGVGELVRMRDRGEILTLDQYPEIDSNTFMSWLQEILRPEDIQKFKKELEFDGATQYEFARVRINVFDTLRGHALVLRLIPLKILTMEQLKLPPIFKDVCEAHKGLILITGPTGSGKSTTLAAMIDYINAEQNKHIITIEDPVEFVHKSQKSLIKQREVGVHTLKFDNALKASLREDPDIILVGEMRDKETVNTALKAAQTGHLVMGTLHTNSAVKTLERIFTLYTAEEQTAIRSALAESLVSIIAQGLCRTTDGRRAAYHDILINTETVKDYILSNKYDEITTLMDEGEFDGMITMNKSLFNLYQEGRITEETALEKSPVRNEMAMMLRGRV
ncbi:PilT/PilU family type 4a pilus ATPase [Cyanobacterium stanieri LEGE 03274]|uniref:PilT/PilU family type 4a pilus ATPase n=1 Tax=Cyanobacterium stanieri LEGE 03274 TaxID=1828756 RepID=A0ABR9V3H5_9CHRO|nr:type IV pilus twitching motility protein PilT [Cyanobacterium stanieri]MBE9222438.1 PilT/PilU family type 4a pilus ATPase [Cyanobacterium stanieri LEGE 03274]